MVKLIMVLLILLNIIDLFRMRKKQYDNKTLRQLCYIQSIIIIAFMIITLL